MEFKFALLLIAAYASTTLALPPCTCTRNFVPVCGSDGQTYSNQCILECESTKNNEITLVKEGTCDSEMPICICTFEYNPVCGSDGQTYPNECGLNCQKAKSPALEVKSRGECVKEEVKVAPIPTCVCTRELKPVCGTDGVTYANTCLLNCAARARSELHVERSGPCEDLRVRVVEEAENAPCVCARDMKPVCASNGKTYNNKCLMRCAGEELTVERSGRC